MFNGICEAIYREMDRLDEKYSNDKMQMNSQDLENIDKLTHALKSIATYEAMQGSSEADSMSSYARGRSRSTGRYISRDGASYGYDPYHGSPESYDRDRRY